MAMYQAGDSITWTELFDLAKAYERPPVQKVYWLVDWFRNHNLRLMRPGNTAVNKLVGISARMFRDLSADRPIRATQENMCAFWSEALDVFQEQVLDEPICPFIGNDALPKERKKRQKFEEALVELNKGNFYYKKNVNLKHNEVLKCTVIYRWVILRNRHERIMEVDIKPRVITDLSAEVHAVLSGYSKALTSWFHNHVDGRTFYLGWTNVRFFFTSGAEMNNTVISQILNEEYDGFTVLVCGDDSLVFGKGHYMTCDYSAFDSTQGRENFENFTLPMLRATFGETWDKVHDIFVRAVSGDFTTEIKLTQKEVIQVSGNTDFQMPTGITFTSILSTIHNMMAIAMSIKLSCWQSFKTTFENNLEMSGYIAKTNWYDGLDGMDYLRHLVIPDRYGKYQLYPMPSCVFKMMKTIENPLSKKLGGYESMMWMTAQCYKYVPHAYPVVGTLVEALSHVKAPSCADSWSPEKIHEGWAYKLAAYADDLPVPDLEACNQVFTNRYGYDLSTLDTKLKYFWTHVPPDQSWPIYFDNIEVDVAALMEADYA
jgi:hypothetical protein